MYADDTVLYYSSSSAKDVEHNLNVGLANVTNWFNDNLLTLNIKKSNFLLIGGSQKLKSCCEVSLVIDTVPLDRMDFIKYLGVTFTENMTWSDHVDTIVSKLMQRLGLLRRIRYLLPHQAHVILYNALILPILDYVTLCEAIRTTEQL